MRAEKLMIGNYFQSTDNTGIQRVTIDDLIAWSQGAVYGKPIELDEENLIKLGWIWNKEISAFENPKHVNMCLKRSMVYGWYIFNFILDSITCNKNINYVHELQIFYFASNGEELTFKD